MTEQVPVGIFRSTAIVRRKKTVCEKNQPHAIHENIKLILNTDIPFSLSLFFTTWSPHCASGRLRPHMRPAKKKNL